MTPDDLPAVGSGGTPACSQHGRAPLTFLQQARLERARQARAAGNPPRSNLVTDAVSVDGPLDLDRLVLALAEVRRRQPALRSRFAADHQVIAPCWPPGPPPRIGEGAGLPAELPPDGPDRYALAVEQVGPRRHRLRLAADHLVFDGRSVDLFWENLWDAYPDPGGHSDAYPDPGGGDGCRCEPGYLRLLTATPRRPDADRDRTEALADLLRGRDSPFGFVDVPVLLPLDQVGSRRVGVRSLPVPESLSTRVVETARRRRATVFAVVTAAVLAALRDLGNTEPPMLYTYLENRGSAGARTAIGWFAATALLVGPGEPAENGPADGELVQVKSLLLDALLHGARRTEEAHRAAGAGPRPATLPSVSLSLGQPPRAPTQVAGLTVTPLAETDEPTGTVPRGRIAIEYWPGLIQLSYETDRFDTSTVQALADAVISHLLRLAQ